MPAAGTSQPVQNQAVLRAGTLNRTLPAAEVVAEQPSPELQAFAVIEPSPTATVEPVTEQEDAVVRAAVEAPPPVLPAYQVYQASDGDSVYSIADKFGISPDYVLANNAELAASGFLSLGQSVIIPAGNGILHEVRFGETLSDIATRYGVTVDDISGFTSNGITDANSLLETQVVYVPNAEILPAAPFGEVPTEDTTDPPEELADEEVIDDGSGELVSGPTSSSGLMWPISGPVSSYYGPSHPLGIDVDGYNLAGSAIVAATSGTVIFAGGNACCSYGLYVVIMSDSGIETLYAHLDSIYVSQGQFVSQGESLGVIGDTGYSTGRHLHFEVIDNGVRQDPMSYLP